MQNETLMLWLYYCNWCCLHWWMFALGWSSIGRQILKRQTTTSSTQADTFIHFSSSSNSWVCFSLTCRGGPSILIDGSWVGGCISTDSWNSRRASHGVTSPVGPPREPKQAIVYRQTQPFKLLGVLGISAGSCSVTADFLKTVSILQSWSSWHAHKSFIFINASQTE